jgi:magnesium transporter
MIRILYSSRQTGLQMDYPLEKLKSALRNKKGLLWLDFNGEPDAACEPILRETFGFHPLAVDDALQETHVPKVDDWGDYLYIVLNALALDPQKAVSNIHSDELDIFLGENYVVTHHDQPIPSLEQVWEACRRDLRHTQSGADHLLYKITDFIVAATMPIVENIDNEIDELEDQIFDHPDSSTLSALFELKRSLLTMRRVLTPQREVLNKLARDDYRVIDPGDRVFFRDVYDHLVRLHDINESMRDLVSGALDIYLSVVNNHLNDVMKTLTIITTVFMPISFIASFYGMNFFEPTAHLVNWTSNPAFLVTLAVVIILPLSMFFWMRRRMWV